MKNGRQLGFLILELESEVFIFIFLCWVGGWIDQWLAAQIGLVGLDTGLDS